MRALQFIAPALRFAMRMGQKQRPPRYIALKIVAAILIGVAAIFALIALHGYLRLYFSGVVTHAIFAGGFAVLALAILLGVNIAQKRYRAPTIAAQLREDIDKTGTQLAGLQHDLYRNFRLNEKSWMLGAAVIGLMLGANLRGKRKKPDSNA